MRTTAEKNRFARIAHAIKAAAKTAAATSAMNADTGIPFDQPDGGLRSISGAKVRDCDVTSKCRLN